MNWFSFIIDVVKTFSTNLHGNETDFAYHLLFVIN